MKIIGITGQVGSGKSLATRFIEDNYLAYTINTDELAKNIIKEDESIKNSKFKFLTREEADKIKLELHPLVWKRVRNIVLEYKIENNFDFLLIETALPSEEFFDICNKTILIKNDIEKKLDLLINHRDYAKEKVEKILELQKDYTNFYNKTDYVIENNGTDVVFFDKIKKLFKEKLCDS